MADDDSKTTAAAAQREARQQSLAYLNGLSDRTRTLCLGTLVLIWGLLTQTGGDHSLDISKALRISLLTVGLLSIFVLVCDFLEFTFGYRKSREQAGGEEMNASTLNYQDWEDGFRKWKIRLGIVALIALCFVLSLVLVHPLFAQELPEYPYYGKWCGGPDYGYTCLFVSKPTQWLVVDVSFANDVISCENIRTGAGQTLVAECDSPLPIGDMSITVSPGPKRTAVLLILKGAGWSDKRLLIKRSPPTF
jgi:hypothetical protein